MSHKRVTSESILRKLYLYSYINRSTTKRNDSAIDKKTLFPPSYSSSSFSRCQHSSCCISFIKIQTTLPGQVLQAQKDCLETWDPEADGPQIFINCSVAFTLLATGDVTTVLPAGSDGKPSKPAESFFILYEWPILREPNLKPDITKVMAYVGNTDGSAPSGDGQELCRNS